MVNEIKVRYSSIDPDNNTIWTLGGGIITKDVRRATPEEEVEFFCALRARTLRPVVLLLIDCDEAAEESSLGGISGSATLKVSPEHLQALFATWPSDVKIVAPLERDGNFHLGLAW